MSAGAGQASWAVTMEGRTDPGGIVLLLDDRSEAESIAREICGRGTNVVVMFYPARWGRSAPSGAVTSADG